jgi:hypothetical protein
LALANNGGSTLTRLPQTGSPASKAGNNTYLSVSTLSLDYNGDGDTSDTLTTDQRGEPRVSGGTVDIGAAEVSAPALTVSISATDPNAAEAGADTGTFVVSRTGATTAALVVTYTVGGRAKNGTDYTPTLTGAATIPDGQTSVAISIIR